MDAKEIAEQLHRYFHGDSYWVSDRYKDGKRWRTVEREALYDREKRLDDTTMIVFTAEDGHRSIRSLTFREIYEALEEILGG